MPIILSTQDWEDQWNADPTAIEDYSQPEPFETLHHWRCELETGWRRTFSLGVLWLKVEEYQYFQDCILRHEAHGCVPASSFFVRGTLKNCHHGLTDETFERPGQNYLEGIQHGIESDHFFADELVCRVRFGLRPEAIQQFEHSSAIPREIGAWVKAQSPQSFYRQGLTTPEMQTILHQILHCPYRGTIKQGNRLADIPRNAASLWTTYELQSGNLEGLGFGLGLFFASDRPGNLNNDYEIPSYVRTDARVAYTRDTWQLALNFKNIFDVDYIQNGSFGRTANPGMPFTVLGSVSVEF